MKKYIRFVTFEDDQLTIYKTYVYRKNLLDESSFILTIINKEVNEIYLCYYNPKYVK